MQLKLRGNSDLIPENLNEKIGVDVILEYQEENYIIVELVSIQNKEYSWFSLILEQIDCQDVQILHYEEEFSDNALTFSVTMKNNKLRTKCMKKLAEFLNLINFYDESLINFSNEMKETKTSCFILSKEKVKKLVKIQLAAYNIDTEFVED